MLVFGSGGEGSFQALEATSMASGLNDLWLLGYLPVVLRGALEVSFFVFVFLFFREPPKMADFL